MDLLKTEYFLISRSCRIFHESWCLNWCAGVTNEMIHTCFLVTLIPVWHLVYEVEQFSSHISPSQPLGHPDRHHLVPSNIPSQWRHAHFKINSSLYTKFINSWWSLKLVYLTKLTCHMQSSLFNSGPVHNSKYTSRGDVQENFASRLHHTRI